MPAPAPGKTFKIKTKTNIQLSQTKMGGAPTPAAGNPPPDPTKITSKPVFVPYQHVPPAPPPAQSLAQQQAKMQGQLPQQMKQTQRPPIQGKLIHKKGMPPVGAGLQTQRPPQSAPPPPPPPPQQQYQQESYIPLATPQQQYAPPQPPQYQQPQYTPPPPPPPAPIINPEASIKEISLNPVGSAPFQGKQVAHQKTGIYNITDSGKVSEDLQKILENEAENYKDQVQSYVDVCEVLSKPGWQVPDIIDYVHMLVRSVNLDTLSIVITDPANKGKLLPVYNRGYKVPPSIQVVNSWLPAITPEATVNWNKLMEIASDKKTKLAKWIAKQGLNFVGYVPLHDNNKIYGFLLVSDYEGKTPSALASPLLELCGGRIGLVFESRRSAGTLPEKAVQTVKLIKDHFSMLTSYLEILKLSGKINPDETVNTAEKCLHTIAESKKLLDRFADDLISSTTEEKKS